MSFVLLSCACFILWYSWYCLLCVLFQLRTQHLHILCDRGNVKKYHACMLIFHDASLPMMDYQVKPVFNTVTAFTIEHAK